MIKWFPERLSPTTDFATFATCQQKWFYERILFLRTPPSTRIGGTNPNLDAGGAFARAMELTRNAYYQEGVGAEEAEQRGLRHLTEDFAAWFTASSYALTETLKTPTNMGKTFSAYWEQASLESEELRPYALPDGKVTTELPLFVELPFTHPVTHRPLHLHCILDLLAFDGKTVVCVDEKTCKSVLLDSAKQTDLLRTEIQFACQVGMVNKLASTLGIPACHTMEVRKVLIGKPNPIRPYRFHIDPTHLRYWWEHICDMTSAMLRVYEAEKGLRDYHGGCTAYFSPCDYLTSCTTRVGDFLLTPSSPYVQLFNQRETGELVPLAQHIVTRTQQPT